MGAVLGTLQRTGWRRPASLPAFRGRPSPWRVAPGRLWLLSLLAGILGFAGALPRDVLAASVQLGLRPEAAQVGQSIELGVTIEGATSVDGEPRIPPVEGLRFRRAGQQTNFSLVNGKMSRSITFQFLIQADKAGEYTIGPVEIQVGKETLRSGKTKLQIVAAGTAPPASGGAQSGAPGSGASGPDPIFVEARIDKSKVYAGEQVTLRLRFCQAVGYRVLETQLETPPSTQGFLREEIPPQRTSTANIDGRTYQVTELVYGLFPTQSGTLEIGPATLRCVVQERRSRGGRRDPFDLFGLFEEHEVVLKSRPVKVEVLPLPNPKPETFTGGVGSFRLRSKIDRTEVEQNEPVTLSFTLDGTGNIAAIGPPAIPEIPGFRTFDGAAPAVTPSQTDDRLGGKKTFQVVLVPETTGQLIIPPLELSYFKTSGGKYQTLSSDSIEVAVTPGTGGPAGGPVTRLGWDLRQIRDDAKLRPIGTSAPWKHPTFWILESGPLALLAVALLARRRKDHEYRHRDRLARERAPGRLRKEIQALSKSGGDADARLRGLDEIWTRYVETRFGFALRGRTRNELNERLRKDGFPDDVIAQFGELLSALDFARFAPGDPGQTEDLIERSRVVAIELEKRPASGGGKSGPSARDTGSGGAGVATTLLLALTLGASVALAQSGATIASGSGHAESSGDSIAESPALGIDGIDGAVSDLSEVQKASPTLSEAEAEARFHAGNEAFRAGEARKAASLYEQVLRGGYESPAVWLNLGNAHFRAGDKGRAVHAYESGRRLAPRDPDLQSNLELALRDIDSAPEVESNAVLEALASSRDLFPLRSALPWVTGIWWALAAWGAWVLYRRSLGRRGVALGLLLGTAWLAGLAWLGVLGIQAETRPDAVVVAESAPVRSNPDGKATVEFHLPGGTLFRTGREAPGFVEVLYSDELRGWMETSGLAKVGRP